MEDSGDGYVPYFLIYITRPQIRHIPCFGKAEKKIFPATTECRLQGTPTAVDATVKGLTLSAPEG